MAVTITGASEECNAMDSRMDLRFLFSTKGEEGRGEEGTEKKEKKRKKKEEKRTLQLASRSPQKTGSPRASTQRQPTQEGQPTEAPNSARKRKEKESQKTRPKRQEGGRNKKEEKTPMNAAHSVLNGRNHHRGKLRVQCHGFTHGLEISFFYKG